MITLLKNNRYRLYTFFAASIFLILMGVLLFFLAGTLNLPAIWVYLALRLGFTVASVLAMSEGVAKERLQPGPKAKPEPLYNILTGIAWVVFIILAPIDIGRFHWSAGFPLWLQVLAAILLSLGYALVVWALRHNEYMSARIRLQEERGQRVIDTGPYVIVRHPNYAGAFLQSLTSGLVLGSWVGAAVLLLHCAALIFRTLHEETVLQAELEGYAEYMRRVRWRFIPGVW